MFFGSWVWTMQHFSRMTPDNWIDNSTRGRRLQKKGTNWRRAVRLKFGVPQHSVSLIYFNWNQEGLILKLYFFFEFTPYAYVRLTVHTEKRTHTKLLGLGRKTKLPSIPARPLSRLWRITTKVSTNLKHWMLFVKCSLAHACCSLYVDIVVSKTFKFCK